MKILLIQPPIQDFYDTDVRLQPIGLCYLKSVAKLYHPDVEVIIKDFHHGHGKKSIPVPSELQYAKKFWNQPDRSPFCGFYHYYHFGLSFEKIRDEIKALNPDVVGISSLFSPYYREVLSICDLVKTWNKDVITLLGGSHINAMPEMMLSHPSVDYIIKGEGEHGFVEFLDYLKAKREKGDVSGLGYKVSDKLVFNIQKENYQLDEIPFPDLSDLNKDHYLFAKKPLCFMVTSRSCPHRCSFCSVHQTFGVSYRRRSVENVFEEIKIRVANGYKVIDFEDDNLTFYRNEMKELCLKIIDFFRPGEVEFVAMNGISYISLDDELMELMKRAGFSHLNLALVSSDKLVREATKRPHTIEKYLQVIDKARELGLLVTSYQIVGLPGETIESMVQTMNFGARLPVLLGASMFYMTPNSPIAKNYAPDPSEEDVFLSRLTAMHFETPLVKREQVYTLFMTTRIINFLKGLDFEDGDTIESLLDKPHADIKTQLGIDILKHLLSSEKLSFATKNGWVENSAFDRALFDQVWSSLCHIKNRKNQKIMLQATLPA